MKINEPDVLAEVIAASDQYEVALMANDTDTLDTLFWDDTRVERVSPVGELLGIESIRSFRAARSTAGLARERLDRRVVCFDTHTAIVNVVFRRVADGKIGRQSQTWVKIDGAWRIVFAHISDRVNSTP